MLFSLRQHLKHEAYRNPMGTLCGFILLITLSVGLADTVWSLFINSFTHDPATTGFISAGIAALTMAYYWFFSAMTKKEHEKKLFIISLFITGITFLLFPFITELWLFLLVAAISFIGFSLRNLSLGFLLRDMSSQKTISINEGLKFVMENLGFLIAPLLIIVIFDGSNFKPPFILAGTLIIAAALSTSLLKVRERHPQPQQDRQTNAWAGFKKFWESQQRTLIYCMRAGSAVFWSYVFIYLPIYVIQEGYPASYIGWLLFAMILPLVLFEYWIGKGAPGFGYRNAFTVGFLVSGGGFIAAFFAPSSHIFVLLMVVSAFGVAFLEPTIEAYFFHITPRSEESALYGTYLTAPQLGLLLGRLGGAILLLFFGLQQIVLSFGIVLFCLAVVSRWIEG